jgi:hypothetical protein
MDWSGALVHLGLFGVIPTSPATRLEAVDERLYRFRYALIWT